MRRILMTGVAVAALVAVGPATGTTVSAGSAPADGAGKVACKTGASSARLMKGASSIAADPNTVSAATARSMQRAFHAKWRSLSPAERRAAQRRAIHRVDVYWHVITKRNGSGNVSNMRIGKQLKVLNKAYKGETSGPAANTSLRFRTADIERVKNNDWYDWASPDTDPSDNDEAKTELHQGDATDLNVYVANLGDQLLGYATFPSSYEGNPLDDGVVVLNASLPGGNAVPYNKGDTLTHEAGHWAGLFHTFQGSCSSPNDHVADTPAQFAGDNIFECDTSLNTCASAGKDPVKNFMNYVDDACMNMFTRGQAKRINHQWAAFRAP